MMKPPFCQILIAIFFLSPLALAAQAKQLFCVDLLWKIIHRRRKVAAARSAI